MAITREEIISILGPVDDELVVELMETGASAEELREAWGWLHNDEALTGAGHAGGQADRVAGTGRGRSVACC